MSKKRILVYLTESEHKKLKYASIKLGISMSAILRRSLEELPEIEEKNYARVQPPEY